MEPRKALTTSLMGWASICLALVIVGLYVIEARNNDNPPGDPVAGFLIMLLFFTLGWWSIGTLIHRSRVRWEIYRRHVPSQPEFSTPAPRGRAHPWRPWEG